MLRDRLRMWGANTKQIRPPRTGDSAVEPSRTMNTNAADFRERHLLKEIDGFHRLSWQQGRSRNEAGWLALNTLEWFSDVAYAAMSRGSRKGWQRVRELADQMAEFDWSYLSGLDVVTLAQEAVAWYPQTILRPMRKVWTNLLLRDLQQSHPIALLLNYLLSSPESDHPRCVQALLAVHESRVLTYADRHEQGNRIADARARTAWALIGLDQFTQADDILYRYCTPTHGDAMVNIDRGYLRSIMQSLGESSYCQYNYEKAVQHFHRAKDLDDGSNLEWTVSNQESLGESLARTGQITEAREVLQELIDLLGHSADSYDHVVVFCQLQQLCENLLEFPELHDTIEELKELPLFKNSEDAGEDDPPATTSPLTLDSGQTGTDCTIGDDEHQRVPYLNTKQCEGNSWLA